MIGKIYDEDAPSLLLERRNLGRHEVGEQERDVIIRV
jgi:hypothetical protein